MAETSFDPARDAWTIPKTQHPFFAKPHGEVLRQAMIKAASDIEYHQELPAWKATRGLLKLEADTSQQLRELSSKNLKWLPMPQIVKTSPYLQNVSSYDQTKVVLLVGAYRKQEVLVEVPLSRPVINDLQDVLIPGGRMVRCGWEDIMQTAGALSRGELCGGCAAHSTALKACSRCHKVKYCNQHCQRLHWPDHKRWCKEHAA